MMDCWRLHPKLMENKVAEQQAENDIGNDAGKQLEQANQNQQGTLMVMSSGKVVGNVTGRGKE